MWSGANSGVEMIALLSKISFVLLTLLLALALLRKQSAAKRVLAAKLGVLALLILPFVWQILPSAHIVLPLAWSAITDAPLLLPNLPGLSYFAPLVRAENSGLPWIKIFLSIYVAISALLLIRLALNTYRLYRFAEQLPKNLSTKISLQAYQQWSEKLDSLRAEYGIRRSVKLLISDHLSAPISWGIWQPVIMIDPQTLNQINGEDVLRHELSHIAQFDWLSLMVARVVAAFYWFHPLVWLMLRHLQFNIECATDDSVLRRGASASSYAQTLMQVSQNAHTREAIATPLAAHGTTLMSRILSILEPQLERQAVSKKAWVMSVLLTVIIMLPLGSLAFIGEHTVWPESLFKQSTLLSSNAGVNAANELDKLNNSNFRALANALRTGQYEQRHALEVESFRQRAAIAALVLALHDQQANTRRLALWGLSEMRFDETAPVIALMLQDGDAMVRAEAARALGDIGDKTWTLSLLPLMRDAHPFVRLSAAHALGDLKDQRALATLNGLLKEADREVLDEIMWAKNEIERKK